MTRMRAHAGFSASSRVVWSTRYLLGIITCDKDGQEQTRLRSMNPRDSAQQWTGPQGALDNGPLLLEYLDRHTWLFNHWLRSARGRTGPREGGSPQRRPTLRVELGPSVDHTHQGAARWG